MPPQARWLTPYDWSRSYLLPDTVVSNIPRRGNLGEFGAWNAARGVLVELCRALDATPISLRYQDLVVPRTRHPIGMRVTAHARRRTGRDVILVYRRESAPYGRRGDYWSVAINGLIPGEGSGAQPPSLPWLGHLARYTFETELHA